MRSFALFVLCTVLLLGTASAWPWRPYGLKLAPSLERRQGARPPTICQPPLTFLDTTAADSASTAAAPSSEMTTAPATTGSKTTASETRDMSTGTMTDTAAEDSTTAASTTTSISVDPRLPPGGVSMITPGPYYATYYKIGQYVTFVWNYTSLSVTPSAVDVVASCSLNDATYTIASNMTVEPTGSVTWDTGEYQATATVPLLTATYTLIIYDPSKPINHVAKAGHLSSAAQLRFGMYIPQKYTPLNGEPILSMG